METTEKWLSTKEAAAELNRKPATLIAWRTNGTGPRYFHTGRVRYRIEDVRAWEAGEAERRRKAAGRRRLQPGWTSEQAEKAA